jgi:uncharacterized protein (DUF433 family)
MKNVRDLITIDQDILGGQPVFKGTRVPVVSLFSHLEKGISLNDFLEDFPTVDREIAVSVLEIAESLFSTEKIIKLYETAA